MSELKHVYHRSALFKKAWGIARHKAKHGGGSVRVSTSPSPAPVLGRGQGAGSAQRREQRPRAGRDRADQGAAHPGRQPPPVPPSMAAFQARFPRRSSGRAFRRAA